MVKIPKNLHKFWKFIWEDDSVWSWIANIIIAFVLIKFIIYPFLGLILATQYPIVAVVSGSMEHDGSFVDWWAGHADYYARFNITQKKFLDYHFKNGFNIGDIMILRGKPASEIGVGEVIVFWSGRPDPIIHRVIYTWTDNGTKYFQTKGDHNPYSINDDTLQEQRIHENQIIGVSWVRVPWLGWVKIAFVRLLSLLGIIEYYG